MADILGRLSQVPKREHGPQEVKDLAFDALNEIRRLRMGYLELHEAIKRDADLDFIRSIVERVQRGKG
jgi:hypothetical protein